MMSDREADLMARQRTTVALPGRLLADIDEEVREGRAVSRNEFLSRAARNELERMRRAEIDDQFEAMAEDPVYRREAEAIAAEYETADWEALRVAEDDS
jgi:metal-responsive CopG/Arc/MetJ family transcriptional regulator